MSDHLGELAALHALGALDARQRAEADAHLAHCEACRRLLAQAEADVTEISATLPHLEPPDALQARIFTEPRSAPSRASWRTTIAAVAAAVVVALLPSAYLWHENLTMHAAMVADSDLMMRMTSTPHRSVAFTGSGPPAMVMYARDGTWYAVIVKHPLGHLHVVWPHDGQETELGSMRPRGEIAFLYLPNSHPMHHLVLMDGTQVVAQAQLAF
jgi:hypothetical protein